MRRNRERDRAGAGFIAAGLVLLLAGAGCAGSSSFRSVFEDRRAGLEPAEQTLLLDTLRVIALLEDYCLALEAKDIEGLLACYSPRYSHYERDLDWRRERIEETYFSPFSRLEASPGEIFLELVRPRTGHWIHQEDIDWLRSPAGERSPVHHYRISLPGRRVPLELAPPAGIRPGGDLPGPPGPDRPWAGRDRVPIPVAVTSQVDPEVERSLGEVKFRLLVRGRLDAGEGRGEFTSTLRERVIFLLEKEEGEWRIISRF